MNKQLAHLLATLCGSGHFPIASGTVGSAVTMPFVILIAYYYGIWGIGITTCILFIIGVYAITIYTQGAQHHDPSCVVIDEAMGQFCTFIPIASYLQHNIKEDTWTLYLLGFFFFRLFDALKPQPAKWADTHIHNAWGVMLDDFFAGIYAACVLYILYSILWL